MHKYGFIIKISQTKLKKKKKVNEVYLPHLDTN